MNITYSDIYKLCSYETSFFKGISYLNSGCVKKVTETKINSAEEYTEAKVKGSHMYNVSIWSENGQPTRCLCDCPAYEKYDGICKHIAAVLLALVPKSDDTKNDRISSVPSGRAEKIIQAYKNSEAVSLYSPSEKAELYPSLHIKDGGRCLLSFKIGLPKKYIIKDLCEFADNISNSAESAYGKNTVFLHNRESFSPRAKKYIDIIAEAVSENRIFNTAFNKYAYLSKLKCKEAELTPHLLDRFMEASEGGEIEIAFGGKSRMLSVASNNPKLNLTFSENNDSVLVKTENYAFLAGIEHIFVITENEIFITDSEYKKSMAPLLLSDMSFTDSLGFNISEADMIFFYNSIIPKISPYSNIISNGADLSKYEMPAPEVSFYIDAEAGETVSAHCEILYGSNKVNPFADSSNNADKVEAFRDTVLEYNIKALLLKYFDSSLDGEFKITDDDAVFEFAAYGIEELKDLGEIFVSDSFKRLSLRPAPKISIGLSLNSGLLELDFYSDEFDLRELKSLLKSYRSKKKYHRLKDGSFLKLSDGELSEIAEAADTLKLFSQPVSKNSSELSFAIPKYRAAYLDRLFSSGGEAVKSYSFRSLIRSIRTAEDNDFEVPETLKRTLRPYQINGFRWLKTIDMYGFGGILADDMGLGKTLQIITLLLSEKERRISESKPNAVSLIVCPASLVYNWESEISRFAPSLTVMTATGTSDERRQKLINAESFDVVITSYDLLKRDCEIYKEKSFRFQIIDEAQYIKNHTTQSARAVKSIQAENRFALTGTPIENRLSELWSIFDFLMPGFLFSYSRFRKELEAPAVKDNDSSSLQKIKYMVSPFILRRLKTDVLKELPEKSEHIFISKMENAQRKLYQANVKILKDTVENNRSSSLKEDSIRILALLMRLRQLCCDPSLCYENYSGGSAKLESCIGLIKEAAGSGHKVLLFSQFTSMLEIIEERLELEGIRFYTLTGATPKEQRLSLVNSFQTNDVPVFLISLKSGGTGLNLTAADVVIHYDPWWNIAAQNQATDRTHRIGQKNPVTVYKLIAKDTVEEKILKLQKNKKQLADSVISENGINIADMTKEELIALLDG